ncbi:hypothetical protein Lal_00004786 [Lupinus albus]|uniref:FRIGIDA-like protein n=1 Tax=Lupinus albus TaxID=3870 RepID=A0A6A4ND40_LUPAL|nr:hypothetical protein Lalb_Chr23g0272801 [Lupinus albus]KAF1865412.1 hypothetical protein Lal_00004786 [Lupinus albus]
MDGFLRIEVESAAVQWRRRLIVEGGVANAVEIDARGLLLFIAAFGIPGIFSNDDVLNLVRLSNPGEISQALRQSQVILKRVSVMAEGLVKRGMAVEVVDLGYTFGFQEKYSIHTMLTSFLQSSEEAWKKAKAKQESHDFPNVLKEANEKYMNDVKSVVNCLEGHKVDSEKLLPGWNLKDKIINMEKYISDINKKIQEKVVPKRKVDKSDSPNKVKIPGAKRSRFPEKDSYVASPSVIALPEQRIASHIDGNNSMMIHWSHVIWMAGSLPESYLGGAVSGVGDMHGGGIYAPAMPAGTNYYPTTSSAPIGSVSGSLPESYLGGIVSGVANMHGGGISAPAMPVGTNYYPTASSAPIGSVSGSLPESHLGGTVSGVGNMHRGSIYAHAMPAITNYYPTASSAPIGSVSGSLPESNLACTVSGANNMHGGGISALAMPTGIGAPSDSYSGYQRDTTMENV